MIPLETLAPFFAASILLGLAPGPDNLFVLTQSALRGRGAGLAVTGGLCTGLLGHTAAVAFGVAVIFQTSALAFSILKYAGAVYLLWLAWQLLRAPAKELRAEGGTAVKTGALYRRGIVMNLSNPKVSLFFLAFLPQFADPARGPLPPQLLLLGGIFIIATILVFGGIALAAGALGCRIGRSPRIQKALYRLTGTLFLGLALRLAMAERG